jgi:hypothetical protein
MFSLTCGRPIAKMLKPKPIILSIFDEDEEKCKKKKCCKNCDEIECQEYPCCDSCNIYYETDSEDSDDGCCYSRESIGTKFSSKGQKLIPLPDFTQRFIEYIAGPSGSGKSTMAAEIAMQFRNLFPDHPIYIMSRTDPKKDPAFNILKPVSIVIDESLVTDPFDITKEITEEGCLIIFDDVTTIHNDKIRKEVEKLMADAMEVGRKLNCNMIITNHLVVPNDKKFARTLLNELSMLTIFPKSGSSQQIRYALKTYFGLNNKQVEEILQLRSRWVRISKSYPQYVLYQEGAYVL